MPKRSMRSSVGSLVLIAAVVGSGAAAFIYTAGGFSPQRVSPARVVDAFAPATGAAPGFRRNHAKGICFFGTFEANGAGVELSKAIVFTPGRYPVTGRFNLAGPNPRADDASARVRGIGLQFMTPDGEEWRSAMIDTPFFPVATVRAFYEQQLASARKNDPAAMNRLVADHPEIAAFGAWARNAPFTQSYAEERYNSLNSFVFTNAAGHDHVVRWSLVPQASPVFISAEEMRARGPNFLEDEISERVAAGPQRWNLTIAIAEPGDPTADPSKAWPDGRRQLNTGTLVIDRVVAEADGPCRDINFDPTVLPAGIRTSDDPFPAARSAAYSESFRRRAAEVDLYPRTSTGAAR